MPILSNHPRIYLVFLFLFHHTTYKKHKNMLKFLIKTDLSKIISDTNFYRNDKHSIIWWSKVYKDDKYPFKLTIEFDYENNKPYSITLFADGKVIVVYSNFHIYEKLFPELFKVELECEETN